jgi:transketolase
MRTAFVDTLAELAACDSRIVLLTGDLGFAVLEPFANAYPSRFFNVGVAEQNMVGIATGLAEAGFIPFVYSIVTFATLRPYEFIRNGPILHRLPVRIVGIGGGMEYAHNGITHYGVEDVGVMRVQPGITIIVPADATQAKSAIKATWNLPGPIYYRLGKDDRTIVEGLDGHFTLGHLELIRQGDALLILTMGAIAAEAVTAADLLETHGINCAVAVVASIQPAPVDDLTKLLRCFPVALSFEAHYVNGGLGSLIAEIIAENNLNCKLIRCGIRQAIEAQTGSQQYLQHFYGISNSALLNIALEAVGKRV